MPAGPDAAVPDFSVGTADSHVAMKHCGYPRMSQRVRIPYHQGCILLRDHIYSGFGDLSPH